MGGSQLRKGAFRITSAFRQHHHAIRGYFGAAHIMGDHQRGDATILLGFSDQLNRIMEDVPSNRL